MSNLINLPTYGQQQQILEKINQGYFETLKSKINNNVINTTIGGLKEIYSGKTFTLLEVIGKGTLLDIMMTYSSSTSDYVNTKFRITVIVDGVSHIFDSKELLRANSGSTKSAIALTPMFCRISASDGVESVLTGKNVVFSTGGCSSSNYIGMLELPIDFKETLIITLSPINGSLFGGIVGDISHTLET